MQFFPFLLSISCNNSLRNNWPGKFFWKSFHHYLPPQSDYIGSAQLTPSQMNATRSTQFQSWRKMNQGKAKNLLQSEQQSPGRTAASCPPPWGGKYCCWQIHPMRAYRGWLNPPFLLLWVFLSDCFWMKSICKKRCFTVNGDCLLCSLCCSYCYFFFFPLERRNINNMRSHSGAEPAWATTLPQSPNTLLPFIQCRSHQSAQVTECRRGLDSKTPVTFLLYSVTK